MVKKVGSSKRYRGPLANPIYIEPPPSPPGLASFKLLPEAEEEYRKKYAVWEESARKRLLEERVEKLELLFKHYDISTSDPERWFLLANKLILGGVPGFSVIVRKRIGKEVEWDDAMLFELHQDVQQKIQAAAQKKQLLSVNAACIDLAKKAPWKGRGSGKTLSNKYHLAVKSTLVSFITELDSDPQKAGFSAPFKELLAKNRKVK